MSLAMLDTHEVVKDLRSAGFTDAQAEAVAGLLSRMAAGGRTSMADTRLEFYKSMILFAMCAQAATVLGTVALLVRT